jgi:hypothetical protein
MFVKSIASYIVNDPFQLLTTYDTARNSTHLTTNFHQYTGTKYNDLHLHILHIHHGAWQQEWLYFHLQVWILSCCTACYLVLSDHMSCNLPGTCLQTLVGKWLKTKSRAIVARSLHTETTWWPLCFLCSCSCTGSGLPASKVNKENPNELGSRGRIFAG